MRGPALERRGIRPLSRGSRALRGQRTVDWLGNSDGLPGNEVGFVEVPNASTGDAHAVPHQTGRRRASVNVEHGILPADGRSWPCAPPTAGGWPWSANGVSPARLAGRAHRSRWPSRIIGAWRRAAGRAWAAGLGGRPPGAPRWGGGRARREPQPRGRGLRRQLGGASSWATRAAFSRTAARCRRRSRWQRPGVPLRRAADHARNPTTRPADARLRLTCHNARRSRDVARSACSVAEPVGRPRPSARPAGRPLAGAARWRGAGQFADGRCGWCPTEQLLAAGDGRRSCRPQLSGGVQDAEPSMPTLLTGRWASPLPCTAPGGDGAAIDALARAGGPAEASWRCWRHASAAGPLDSTDGASVHVRAAGDHAGRPRLRRALGGPGRSSGPPELQVERPRAARFDVERHGPHRSGKPRVLVDGEPPTVRGDGTFTRTVPAGSLPRTVQRHGDRPAREHGGGSRSRWSPSSTTGILPWIPITAA